MCFVQSTVHERGRRLHHSLFRPMAEVSFQSSLQPNTRKKRSLLVGNSNYRPKLKRNSCQYSKSKVSNQVPFDSLKSVLRTHIISNIQSLFMYNLFIYVFIYLFIYLFMYPFTYFFLTACSINYDWNVFLSGEEHNFLKYNNSLIDSLGTRYDYLSVMHYSQDAFSRNGLPTILVKREGVSGRYIIRIVTYH